MIKDILNSLPVLLISIVATVTGGTAVSKVAKELQPSLNSDNREIQEVRVAKADDSTLTDSSVTPTPTEATTGTPSTIVPTPTAKALTAAANGFTLATLAQHNKGGNCYVAYKGVVYNASNNPSWQNCMHHGTTGGRDITSTFPHSTSYFSTLPKVGTMIKGSGSSTSTGTTSPKNDDSDDEDENEQEDEHEDEQEND